VAFRETTKSNWAGESKDRALKLAFDRRLKIAFLGARTPDYVLIPAPGHHERTLKPGYAGL
jgi:hypothetical protein